MWNISNRKCTKTLVGHAECVSCLSKLDENTIVSGSYDYSIKIWNLITGTCVRTLIVQSSVNCMYNLNKYQIVSGSDDKTLKVWDLFLG